MTKAGRPRVKNPRKVKRFTFAPSTIKYLDHLRSQGVNQSRELERLIQASEMYRAWENGNGQHQNK